MATNKELQAQIAELERSLAKAQTVEQISQRLNAANDEATLLEVLTELALETKVSSTYLFHVDLDENGEPEWAEVAAGWQREGVEKLPVGMRFYLPDFLFSDLWFSSSDEPQLFVDVTVDERVDKNARDAFAQAGTVASAIIPLVYVERWVGLVSFSWSEAHEFSPQERETYNALISLTSPVVLNRRLMGEVEENLQQTQVRFEVSQALAGAQTEQDVLDVLLLQAGVYPEAQVVLSLYDPRAEEPTLVVASASSFESGIAPAEIGSRFPASRFQVLSLLTPGEPFVVFDLITDERIDLTSRQYLGGLGNVSMMVITMAAGDEQIGILRAGCARPGYFDAPKINLYQALANQGATAVRAARLRVEVQQTQEQYRQIVEGSLVGFFRTTPAGQIVEANPAVLEIIGYDSVQDANETGLMNMYVDPTARQKMLQTIQAKGQITGYQVDFWRKDRTIIPILLSARLVLDETGKPVFLEGALEDITERKRAEETIQQVRARVDTLFAISRDLNAASDEDEVLQVLARLATETGAFDANLQYIELDPDGEPEWIVMAATWQREGKASVPVGARFYIPDFPFVNLWLSNPDGPTLIADVATDERVGENLQGTLAQMHIGALAVMPLVKAGRWIGLAVFNWHKAHEFEEQEAEMYQAIVDMATSAVGNRRLLIEQERALTETLYRISSNLTAAAGVDELLQILVQPVIETRVASASLQYIELDQAGEPEWLIMTATWQREGEPPAPAGTRFYIPEFPFASLWLSNPNEPMLVADVATDERVDKDSKDMLAHIHIAAFVVVPLTQAGERIGIVTFEWPKAHEFDERETEIYRAFIGLATPAVAGRQLTDNLEQIVAERTAELARLLDNIRDSVISTDLEGTILSWNRAAEHIYGWTAKEAIGKNMSLLYKEQDVPILMEKITTPTLEKGHQEGEYWALRKGGEEFLQRLATSLVLDDEGKPAGMVGISSDITEQEQAKAEQERLQQEIIRVQRRAIQELATPIIPIMERIIIVPLVGVIDSQRARETTRALLAGISEYRAQVVILDITGVPLVDSGVAAHLDKTMQAARLKGARAIITGVSDAVAETIVDLGIDWSGIETRRDLQTGLRAALESMGIKLTK